MTQRFPNLGNGEADFFQALEKLLFRFSKPWKVGKKSDRRPSHRLPWLLAVVGMAGLLRAADAPPNAADSYRRAWKALPMLSDAENALIRGETSDADAAALSSKLAPALALYRSAARMGNCDWGLDFEKSGVNTREPDIGPIGRLASLGTWAAERVRVSDPAEFVAWHEDNFRASAHVGQTTLMGSGLLEAAMRRGSLAALGANLAALPPDLLAKLNERLAALPPPPDFQKIMQWEKVFGIDWFIRHLIEKHREHQDTAAATNFAAKLRMSAMVAGGPVGLKIGLEEVGGDSFWVGLGQRKRGIELVSADLKRGEAVLFKDGQAALVFLREKRIEPISVRLINAELERVCEEDTAQQIIQNAGSNSTQLVRQLMATSDLMGAVVESAAAPVKDPMAWGQAIEEQQKKNGAIVPSVLMLPLGWNRTRLDAARADELMLRVAVDVLREGPAAAARSHDPWGDGAPFTCRQTADGYEIVSQFQPDGKPSTLKVPRR